MVENDFMANLKAKVIQTHSEVKHHMWTIKWRKAELTRDVEGVGRQDPYLVVKCGEKYFKTHTHSEGGKTPVWNRTMDLILTDLNVEMTIDVMDADPKEDDKIGSSKFIVKDFVKEGTNDQEIRVTWQDKDIGKIMVTSTFERDV